MKAPATPANEPERLAALRAYEVLDTPMEAAFDALARLAAHVLEVPIALISLVDADRQWFKARYGLDVPQLDRNVSFCGHVVADDAPLIVSDAFADERFHDNPVVTGEPHVRFYAGMPLRSPAGLPLGSLCAIDHVPREPSPEQLEMLSLLAGQVVLLLEKRRLRLETVQQREEARTNARRLEGMFEAMAEGVVVQDELGQISSSNSAASLILGLSPDEIRGRRSVDPRWRAVREDGSAFPGEEHPAMVALRTGEMQRNVVMGVHKPDGTLTWISINSLIVSRGSEGVGREAVTTFHDITPIKLAAERLSQQDRLIMTGTLVAGIGHEINNPLSFVLGNLELALEEIRAIAGPSPSARLREVMDGLNEARTGADRIRRIVRGLRALAREDVTLQAVDLESVVETSLSMALHEMRLKAQPVVDVSLVPAVLGDESRLTQVLVNLLMNAAQAFPTPDPVNNRVTITAAAVGTDRVRLSVRDNGPGIPEAIVGRIFDPFFTTKPVGEGTGLGLAVSRGIVHAMGGELELVTAPGEGTTFHITLRTAESADQSAGASDGDAPGDRGRIMMIDDDLGVLAALKRVLVRDHDVTTISDPREALDLVKSGARFDVIFCDIMMPHLSGDELYMQVRAVRPDAAERFVFVTGGATSAKVRLFLSSIANDVVEKPIQVQELKAMARRYVLRRPSV